MQQLKVYKFGGASVRDDVSLRQVASIIRSAATSPLVVVLSAMGKTTNALEKITDKVFVKEDPLPDIDHLYAYHLSICRNVFPPEHTVFRELDSHFSSLRSACITKQHLGYNALYDSLVSFGEKFSTCILHHFLLSNGIENNLLDSTELVKTDECFRAANVDWILTRVVIRKAINPSAPGIWVVQGFIGSSLTGQTITLGREGSDYSAAIYASALDAREVTIWKDVPGVLNADPAESTATVKFDRMPYQEALELAFYGAKVIHPKTIKPLENKNIELLVKPFSDPLAPGTLISSDPELYPQACSAIWKREQILFTLRPRDLSFISEAHVHGIMGALALLGIHQNLMQSSALHFSFCCDYRTDIVKEITEALGEAYHILHNQGLSLLTLRHFSEEDIQLHAASSALLMQQMSRVTYQALMKEMH
jgi:aspartate kinase